MRNWILKYDGAVTSQEILRNVLLRNRGIEPDSQEAQDFFVPPDPADVPLADVGLSDAVAQRVVALVEQFRDAQKPIVVFGDYDADGVCATSVLWLGLKQLGVTALPIIPKREHGYGLTTLAVNEILLALGLIEQQNRREDAKATTQRQRALIITVDNGIVAYAGVRALQAAGCTVVVTDHHQPEEEANEAHPADVVFHTTQLCGTSVAWFLVKTWLSVRQVTGLLDLAAIATLADIMPLRGIHRAIVWHGLQLLRSGVVRAGVRALAERAHVILSELDEISIGYRIVPRLNALGRIGHNLDAVRLLCTGSPEKAHTIAETLEMANQQRQHLADVALQEALTLAQSQLDATPSETRILIVASSSFHEGVIGLIANHVMQRFALPTLAMTIGESEVKGSARSVAGVHITQLLRSVRRHLLDIGGHAQAAGFSLHKTQYDAFVDAVRDEMKKPAAPDKETLQNSLEMECELSPEMLSVESVDNIALFQPFGPSNPHPIFRTPPLVCTQAKRIGSAQQHVRCTFALLTPSVLGGAKQIAHTFSAVRWGKPTQPAPTPPTDQPLALATQLRTNTWQSVTKLQLEVLEWS